MLTPKDLLLMSYNMLPNNTKVVLIIKCYFRFDCGSGIGVVRSEETVLLNQWNHLTLYRHRWDAWLQLNNGKHVQVNIIFLIACN